MTSTESGARNRAWSPTHYSRVLPYYIFQFPTYSPDGSKILFLAPTGGGGAPEVNVANADGSDMEAVTSPATVIPEEHPRFSPDGAKIAFSGSLPESVSEEYN